MILVDTSVWISILRDKTGDLVQMFRRRIDKEIYLLTRFTQLELLQGAKNTVEWTKLDRYLTSQFYLEASERTWREAARIFFDLRRKGKIVHSPIDCCIAQIAIEADALLLHQDHDFITVAGVRPLKEEFWVAQL